MRAIARTCAPDVSNRASETAQTNFVLALLSFTIKSFIPVMGISDL